MSFLPSIHTSQQGHSQTAKSSSSTAVPYDQRINLRIRSDWADRNGYRPDGQKQYARFYGQTQPQPPASHQPTHSQPLSARPSPPPSARMEESKQEQINFQTTAPFTPIQPPFPIMAAYPPLTSPPFPFPPPASVFPPMEVFNWNPPGSVRSTAKPNKKPSAKEVALMKSTHFVPFNKQSHIMTPTASRKAHLQPEQTNHPPPAPATVVKERPIAHNPNLHVPVKKVVKRLHQFAHLPTCLQDTPFAAMIARSVKELSVLQQEHQKLLQLNPHDPIVLAHQRDSAPLPLPDGLDALQDWEREMLQHFSKAAGQFFRKDIPPTLHPTPLELLFFLEHFAECEIKFDSLQDAVEACQREKEAVRKFLNHKTGARGILKEWSNGTLEEEKLKGVPAETKQEDLDSSDDYVERVDDIDLTLLFEQTRCGGNLLFHLRNLHATGATFRNSLHLTSAIMEEEKNFQLRLKELGHFLSSAKCILFTPSSQPTLTTVASIYSLLKSCPDRRTYDELLIRCYSWNEKLKEQKRRKELQRKRAHATSPHSSVPTTPRPRKHKRKKSVQSKVAAIWQQPTAPAVTEATPVDSQPTAPPKPRLRVFKNLEDMVALVRFEESNEFDDESDDEEEDSFDSLQLSTFLLGKDPLIGHANEITLDQLESLQKVFNQQEEAENDESDEKESTEKSKVTDPTASSTDLTNVIQSLPNDSQPSSGVSTYEQLIFHLKVIREEHLVQQRQLAIDAALKNQPLPSRRPAFSSLTTLLAAIKTEHLTSLKRREAILLWLLEESDLFTLVPIRPKTVDETSSFSARFQSLSLTTSASGANLRRPDSIISPDSLTQLYFRTLSSGGVRLLHHIKQFIWSQIPSPSNSYQVPALEDCFVTKNSDGLPVAITPRNNSFDFAYDITKFIAAIENESETFQTLAQELHQFLTQPSCALLTSETKRTCNLDACGNILFFAETGRHTLSYLQRWNLALVKGRNSLRSNEIEDALNESFLPEKPFESIDDLVDALITYHVIGIKRNLISYLEQHFVAMCPSLTSLNDFDVERIFSRTRSLEQLLMVFKFVEPPTTANLAANKSDAKKLWIDSDESSPTLYATLGEFVVELHLLAKSMQQELDSTFTFLTSDACKLWRSDLIQGLIRELVAEPEHLLELFHDLGLEAGQQLRTLNETHPGQFTNLAQLHGALVTAYRAYFESRKPKRAVICALLESENTWLLRPFFRKKLLRQRQQRVEDEKKAARRKTHGGDRSSMASSGPSSGYGSRRASMNKSRPVSGKVQESMLTHSTSSQSPSPPPPATTAATTSAKHPITFPLTERQIDGILAAGGDSSETVLVLLNWLNDLYAEFDSVEALVLDLTQLYGRMGQVRDEIKSNWDRWKLINASQPTNTSVGSKDGIADLKSPSKQASSSTSQATSTTEGDMTAFDLRLVMESHCGPDVVYFLRSFASSGHTFQSLNDLIYFLQKRWSASCRTRRSLFKFLSTESVWLFPETPGKRQARIEVQREEQLVREERLKEDIARQQQAYAAMSLPGTNSSLAVNAGASSQRDETSRSNRRGSMAGRLLPQWPTDSKPADASATATPPTTLDVSNHVSRPATAATTSSDVDDLSAEPWVLTQRSLHELLMRCGPHVPFFIHALYEAGDVDQPHHSFETAAQLTAAVEAMQEAAQRAVYNFIFDRHASVRRAVEAGQYVNPNEFNYEPLPQHILQPDIYTGPAHPLLSSQLIGELLEGDEVISSSPRLVQLFHSADELTPYTLFFHLTHLSNPFHVRSSAFDVYRRFVPQMPFTSWTNFLLALRECQAKWLEMREEVYNLLTKHQQAAAAQVTILQQLSQTNDTNQQVQQVNSALASVDGLDPSFISFFSSSTPPIRLIHVDRLLLRTNSGLDSLTWLKSYSDAAQRAPFLSDAPFARTPMFQDLHDLQAQLSADTFACSTALDALRTKILSELSDHRSKLFEKPVQISVQELDGLLDLVLTEKDLTPASVLSDATKQGVEDVIWLIQYMVKLGRSFLDWATFRATLQFHWSMIRDKVVPDLFQLLNTYGRNMCGFLQPHQALSIDGVNRLVRQSFTGIYAQDLIEFLLDGSSAAVLPAAPAPIEKSTEKGQSKKKKVNPRQSPSSILQQTIHEEVQAAASALTNQTIFDTLDDMIRTLRTLFLTQILPSFHSAHASLSLQLPSIQSDLFYDPDHEVIQWDRNQFWTIFDASGAKMKSQQIIHGIYEDFKLFKNIAHLIQEMSIGIEKEKEDRKILFDLFADPQCRLLTVVPLVLPGSPGSNAVLAAMQQPKSAFNISNPPPLFLTKSLIERLITQGSCGSASTRSLILNWQKEGRTFPSYFDLLICLRETAANRDEETKEVLRQIHLYLYEKDCFLLSPSVLSTLKERQIKHILKVSGNDGALCLALLKYLNQGQLPITASAAVVVEHDPQEIAASPPATGDSRTSTATGSLGPASPPAFKDFNSLVSALLALYRVSMNERNKIHDFFQTAAAFELEDRCKLWSQAWRPEQIIKPDSNQPIPMARTQAPSEDEPIPVVTPADALKLMISSSACIHTFHFLLQLNREEPYTFRTMESISLAVRNLYFSWDEGKRAIGRFLESKGCILLPKRNPLKSSMIPVAEANPIPATTSSRSLSRSESQQSLASVTSSESYIPGSRLTLKLVDRMIDAYGHGTYAPHKLLTFLRTYNDDQVQQHLNPRGSSLGLDGETVLSQAVTQSTVLFHTLKDFLQFLQQQYESVWANSIQESYDYLTSLTRCTLLRGPFRSESNDNLRANIEVSKKEVEMLASESGARIYLLGHLQALQRKGFQCTSIDLLLNELKDRVKYEGEEHKLNRIG